jgi:hypothetical protein
MNRRIQFHLNTVTPTPATLRANPGADFPATELDVNLGQLFLQYYFDSYPAGPPNPDPSSFEYLQLVSSDEDFRFYAFVAEASLIKRRAMSAEIGQAFCRLMLHDHFGVSYFAHMNDVIERGWQLLPQLGAGHAVFVGLDASVATHVVAAARGDWHALDNIASALSELSLFPQGGWPSEFAWLSDGTVAAPLTSFLPTGAIVL